VFGVGLTTPPMENFTVTISSESMEEAMTHTVKKKNYEVYPLNCNKELECQVKGIYRTLNSNEERSVKESWVSKSTVNSSYWNFLKAEIIHGFTYW
jgi:hypothetical protein